MATAFKIDNRTLVTPTEVSREVDFVERELALAPGSRLLAIPCGTGLHAVELAWRGHDVNGIDPSREAVEGARLTARRLGVAARFAVGELRDLATTRPYDALLCLGDTLSAMEPREAQLFLNLAAAALKPGGRLVIDSRYCAESLFPLPAGALYDPRSSMLKLAIASRIETRRVTTSGELVRMLWSAGLRATGLFADADGTAFAPGAHRLLLVAERAY